MQQVIVFRHFSRLPIIFLSLVQLGLGLGCMAAQIGGIFTKNPTPGGKPYSPIVSTYLGATGIWAGIFMVFAGIAGFVSSRFRVPGAIMSFMVISVVAALVSPAIIVTSTISIMEMEDNCKGDLHCTDDNLRPKMVLDIVLIVLAAVEYCIASACVITCCWTLYCDPAGYQFEYHDTKRSAKYKRNDVEMHPTHQVQDKFSDIAEEEEPEEDGDKWRSTSTTKTFDEDEEQEEDTEPRYVDHNGDGGIVNHGYNEQEYMNVQY